MSKPGTGSSGSGPRILVVRLSSLGDILHALPAVATLKSGFPGSEVSWVVHSRWVSLLEGNPYVDRKVALDRSSFHGLREAWRALRRGPYDFAVDFQGLVQSAVIASLARADRIYGFDRSQVRERLAASLYSHRVKAGAAHVVERNLELAAATGASTRVVTFPLPEGTPEGELPEGEFVLASPLAGWAGKQWPLENYGELARRIRRELGMTLVLNAPSEAAIPETDDAVVHVSGVAGLIWATRRAAAVVGIDSGPTHLAAALDRPGVALFGPTDPARNGPYGDSFTVLRSPGAETTYKRWSEPHPSMRALSPDEVFAALRRRLSRSIGCASL
jgi:heptosyltransferase-1